MKLHESGMFNGCRKRNIHGVHGGIGRPFSMLLVCSRCGLLSDEGNSCGIAANKVFVWCCDHRAGSDQLQLDDIHGCSLSAYGAIQLGTSDVIADTTCPS